ncbi:MAG TPA: nickel pincer cofactor biosynthesis protein LarC [Desulfobulbaceae bacterium]|nr:nickel pincer cofactor biosynthesis protein LarC [Desulfobulbaceae bacterium]HHD63737.1 nickel pincer cofactor biosynthesis protein LarC [Desulfobulbaceae bacterium]
MQRAYLDCFSGVSGNMLLGALLHAGLEEKILRETLASLPVSGYRLTIQHTSQQGLAACHVQVEVDHDQPHRHLQDISDILAASTLPDSVKKKSLAVFTRLAEAEAAVHGAAPEQVHFHEVGAVDALIDVVGTVAGFHLLGIEKTACSPLPMPHGLTKCAHGTIPLPAPAVSALLEGIPVYGVDLARELVTPTGAALVCALADDFGPMPAMILQSTGYGAGSNVRKDGCPNLLRLCLGREQQVAEAREVEIIETHLDDWNPEPWPHVSERLMAAGALDVSLTPIQMKKGRPGFELKVICGPAHTLALKQIILTETSAIGLRFHRQQRMILPRKKVAVKTRWGMVEGKEIKTPGGTVITPEYESCRALAKQRNIPLQRIYSEFCRCSDTTEVDY